MEKREHYHRVTLYNILESISRNNEVSGCPESDASVWKVSAGIQFVASGINVTCSRHSSVLPPLVLFEN